MEWNPYWFTIVTKDEGQANFKDVLDGPTKIFVTGDDGETREYQLPRGSHINVQESERVKAGEPLMDGPIDPHDILRVRGEKELQRYLFDEIQEVYRLQGVNINDKHIEVIAARSPRRSSSAWAKRGWKASTPPSTWSSPSTSWRFTSRRKAWKPWSDMIRTRTSFLRALAPRCARLARPLSQCGPS